MLGSRAQADSGAAVPLFGGLRLRHSPGGVAQCCGQYGAQPAQRLSEHVGECVCGWGVGGVWVESERGVRVGEEERRVGEGRRRGGWVVWCGGQYGSQPAQRWPVRVCW